MMEYYWALKRSHVAVLLHDMTWVNLEDIMLSEASQSQKGKHCMIPSHQYEVSKAVEIIGTPSCKVIATGGGGGRV